MWLILFMIVGSVAELVSLASVVPFLTALSDPQAAREMWLVKPVLDLISPGEDKIILTISIGYALLVIVATLIRLFLLRFSNGVVFGIGYELGVGLYGSILHRDYEWHIKNNTSEVLGGLNKAQIAVQGYLLPLMNAAVALVLAFGLTITLLIIDTFLALIGAGSFALIYFLLAFSIRSKVSRFGKTIASATNRKIKEAQEGLGGIRDIILDSGQEHSLKNFSKIDKSLREAQAKNNFYANSPRLAIEGLGLVLMAIIVMLSALESTLESILPVLGVLGIGAQKLLPLIQMIYQGWNATTLNRNSLHDVIKLTEVKGKIYGEEYVEFNKNIVFSNVSFKYNDEPNSAGLTAINVEILKKEIIGIVGKTGSGKSTYVDILMGLLQCDSGEILIDGISLSRPSLVRGWRKKVAHVPQSIFLIDGTIKENIAFGSLESDVDFDKVVSSAKAAYIHHYIEELPQGYNTKVGERGVNLSGGQCQRIGIARALYKDADLLVLDEATSALDQKTENEVIQNILRLKSDLTIVMVAHRLETLRNCNRILQMEGGKLINTLTYEKLQQL